MTKRVLFTLALLLASATGLLAGNRSSDAAKLDAALHHRSYAPRGSSRIIIQTVDGSMVDALVLAVHGTPGRRLALLGAQVAEVPDAALAFLAAQPVVRAISLDRRVRGTMERTAATVGASWVNQNLGLDGSSVGVAIIDSGVTAWHDDLGASRVVRFVDFVSALPQAYDDFGHGTHVAGIIAGSGYDSNRARRGIAPGAHLVALKVLDATGNGYISNVIAALDYAVAARAAFNIRIINLSVAAGVYESYDTDPLAQAAKRAVETGIVVVSAAGNLGRNAKGEPQYGGIAAPGNAPWVLTVGASSHMGTTERSDDAIANFSSRGPSYIDFSSKPDIVAPGVGIESLADAGSRLFLTRPTARLWGAVPTVSEPYLSLSGTSMAAPVVAGTVALMLQANPLLTPNAVKAILQYTAEVKSGYNHLTQGAGFLNARGAVGLAQKFAGIETRSNDLATAASGFPMESATWSRHIIWGNHRIGGGVITPAANAWRSDVVWGAAVTELGEHVTWGVACDATDNPACENIVWGTACGDSDCENIVWGTAEDENVVWGSHCGGGDDCQNIVWGTASDDENIVWGTMAGHEKIVWGTACDARGSACKTVIWDALEHDRRGTRPVHRRARLASTGK